MSKYDVVIIGSGIGGLCCASLLALAGKKVLICEAHNKPGGVAHSFTKDGYKFESGPSLWSGLNNYSTNNPLGQILKLLDEAIEVKHYKGWRVLFPESNFDLEVGDSPFRKKINELRGENSLREWDAFISEVKPLSKIISKMPLLTTSPTNLNLIEGINLARKFLPNIQNAAKLRVGFGKIAEKHLNDPFLLNWVDLLSFLISGMPMNDTNTAAMSTLFDEWFQPNSCLDYPVGGSESVVDALIRGLKKYGGEIILSSKVKEIAFKNNLACGVHLENNRYISSDYVVSNCDIWNFKNLLPQNLQKRIGQNKFNVNKCKSFLHIHLGFDASNLKDLPIHAIWVDKWERGITADKNIAVFSIPSVLDPTMAPKGKHVLHGYTPANEPWEIWKDLKQNSKEYKKLKEERCEIFLHSLKKIIPDIEERIEIKMLGTPITHKKFTNTESGSYGPAISASKSLFPGCKTKIDNLLLCGASTFPGIGIPAVAASGAYATEAIIGKKNFKKLIGEI
tara:strand:+ start:3208 stop:4731 length:1524 start_codon:yes stop_codon:yes gene_type:complete